MNVKTMPLLSKGAMVAKQYQVIFHLKSSLDEQLYRVVDRDNNNQFLRLYSACSSSSSDEYAYHERTVAGNVHHENLLNFRERGEITINKESYHFIVFDFISGETLASRVKRESNIEPVESKNIIVGILNGVKYLHEFDIPLIHNGINPENIMLDYSQGASFPIISSLKKVAPVSENTTENIHSNDEAYSLANEALKGSDVIQSDIFSVGVVYYYLLFAQLPWFEEYSSYKLSNQKIEDLIIVSRKRALLFPETEYVIESHIFSILKKALAVDVADRFNSASEFINAIQSNRSNESESSERPLKNNTITLDSDAGFNAIAGMDDLKKQLQVDVIDALQDKALYKKYGLSIPNGLLLYGPPGCGKTFFAEKLAEQVGFPFYQIKPSDIQSKWVNATQGNISALFNQARKNAPSIIFIDELDALVPKRDNDRVNHMNTSAVNEFLTQMNNCGDDGVFVIGATNLPDAIDPAILRSGRLDKTVLIPAPDLEARKKMFELYLHKRPVENDINYSVLARASEGYVSSDIKHLCDEAARCALTSRGLITEKKQLDIIAQNTPSLSISELKKYLQLNN